MCLENLGFTQNVDRGADKDDLYQILIKGIPIPDESVSWQDILKYRKESDAQKRLRELHSWVADMANGTLSYADAENKVQVLKDQYRSSVRGAGFRHTLGAVQTVVVTVAGVLGDALRLNLANIANAPFELVKSRLDYLEAERNAPGRELSYAVRVQETFG